MSRTTPALSRESRPRSNAGGSIRPSAMSCSADPQVTPLERAPSTGASSLEDAAGAGSAEAGLAAVADVGRQRPRGDQQRAAEPAREVVQRPVALAGRLVVDLVEVALVGLERSCRLEPSAVEQRLPARPAGTMRSAMPSCTSTGSVIRGASPSKRADRVRQLLQRPGGQLAAVDERVGVVGGDLVRVAAHALGLDAQQARVRREHRRRLGDQPQRQRRGLDAPPAAPLSASPVEPLLVLERVGRPRCSRRRCGRAGTAAAAGAPRSRGRSSAVEVLDDVRHPARSARAGRPSGRGRGGRSRRPRSPPARSRSTTWRYRPPCSAAAVGDDDDAGDRALREPRRARRSSRRRRPRVVLAVRGWRLGGGVDARQAADSYGHGRMPVVVVEAGVVHRRRGLGRAAPVHRRAHLRGGRRPARAAAPTSSSSPRARSRAGCTCSSCRSGPREIAELQAASAMGQGRLYRTYDELLREKGVRSAQVLLTFFDMSARTHYLNARRTLQTLLDWRVVPVINENDTTTTDEISFGDNDFLAAQVAVLLPARQLILLTDTAGRLHRRPAPGPRGPADRARSTTSRRSARVDRRHAVAARVGRDALEGRRRRDGDRGRHRDGHLQRVRARLRRARGGGRARSARAARRGRSGSPPSSCG